MAQRVQQFLTMKRLFSELIFDGGNDNWITVPLRKIPKPTQAVNKLLSPECRQAYLTLPLARLLAP